MTGSVVSPVLVGRDDEIAVLRDAYERARSRPSRGRSWSPARRASASRGWSPRRCGSCPAIRVALYGGCLELGSEGAPYVPFVAVLRDLVRRFGRDRVAALLPPGGAALGDWLPDLGPAPAPRTGRPGCWRRC